MIDQASVFAERYKHDPKILQATVLGQGTDPSLDPYTALRALQLIKESNAMQNAQQAQGPTSAPSLASQAVAPQGLAALMPMGAPAGQMPQQGAQAPQAQAPQAPAMQASGGLAGLPTPDHEYAAGGIVAFDGGGITGGGKGDAYGENYSGNTENGDVVEYDPVSGYPVEDSAGNSDAQGRFNRLLMQQIADMRSRKGRTTSPEDAAKQEEEYYQREQRRAGPNIYDSELARNDEYEADRRKDRNSGQGLALLAAAGKILKGNTLAMGASEALPAFAQQMGEVQRADSAAKGANAKMQFALKDAQRKERMGASRAAQASMENYRKFQQDENKAEFDRDNAVAQLAARGVVGNRATGKGAGGGAKLPEQLFAANVDHLKSVSKPTPGETPEAFDARIRAQAGALTAQQVKTSTSYSTSEIAPTKAGAALAPVQERVDAAVAAAMKPFSTMNSAYRAAVRTGNTAEAQRLWKAEEKRQRDIFSKSEAAAGGKGGGDSRSSNPNVIKLED